jgi:predicted AlkP superfamily phosphohydrolase/phosphomutase
LERELADRGLVKIVDRNGKLHIDWLRSKVFVDLTNIYVNLKSRYLEGMVEDEEYEAIIQQLLDLRGLKDQDGEYVLSFVLKKSEAPMIGLWGEYIGDVVFAYNSGYSWGPDQIPTTGGSINSGGANHGSQIPTTETAISSNYATFMILGKDIKKGYIRPVDQLGPIPLIDIAPTIAYILGISPPRHSLGHILYDFFEGWDVSPMPRSEKHMEFPIYLPLIGDVTDRKEE